MRQINKKVTPLLHRKNIPVTYRLWPIYLVPSRSCRNKRNTKEARKKKEEEKQKAKTGSMRLLSFYCPCVSGQPRAIVPQKESKHPYPGHPKSPPTHPIRKRGIPCRPTCVGLPPCFAPLPFLFLVFPILSLFPHNKYQNGFIKSIQPYSHADRLCIGSFAVIYILPLVKLLCYLKFFLPLLFFHLIFLHKTSRNNCLLYTPHKLKHTHILII